MKKHIIFCVLMVSAVVLGFSDEQEVRNYEAIYNAAETYVIKLNVIQEMVRGQISDAGDFYARLLKKLVPEYSNIKNKTEQAATVDQVILLTTVLGAEKYAPAAATLWMVAEEFDSPKAKAEAMIALGMIGAAEYLPHVTRVLENLNLENRNSAARKNRISAEQIAHGAIIALEKYQDPSGYLPVFFASIGWYSKEVKDQAVKSLPLIAEDPSPYMSEIIKGPGYDYPTKLAALRSVEAARVDNAKKTSIAVEAFNQGWLGASVDVRTKTSFATDMRKLSIQMISKYKSEDESIYPLLERSYVQGYDMQEKLYAVTALASQKTSESARCLSKFLDELNAKSSRGGIKREDEQMVRAIIPALGQTGRAEARASLSAVRASNWTPAVINLANDALNQIN